MSELQKMVSLLDEIKKTILDKDFQIRENSSKEEIIFLISSLKNVSQKIGEISSRLTGRIQAD